MRLNVIFQEQEQNFIGVKESDEKIGVNFGQTETVTATNYHNLTNKPQINSVVIDGNVSLADLGLRGIYYDTTANWNANRSLIAEEGSLYIYKDYQTIYDEVGNPTYIAGIKVGDGSSYLIDMPFVSGAMTQEILNHISNTTIHVTAAEKQFWNHKVSSYMDHEADETLILSKTKYEHNGEIFEG